MSHSTEKCIIANNIRRFKLFQKLGYLFQIEISLSLGLFVISSSHGNINHVAGSFFHFLIQSEYKINTGVRIGVFLDFSLNVSPNLHKGHGQSMHKALLDNDGKLDLTIQVMLNEEGILNRDQYSKRVLKDGEKVIFMILVGGG